MVGSCLIQGSQKLRQHASMHQTRDQRLSRTAGYYAAFIALGLATAALGPTLPFLAEHTQTHLSEISSLFTAHALGYLIGSFQGGRLYDRVPGHPLMAAALIIMALMLAMIPVLPLLLLLALAVFFLGMAGGALDVGGNTLLVWVYGRDVGPPMNGLHFFFGVGAFLCPIIVAQAVLLSGDITWAYWTLACLLLPVPIWLLRLSSPVAQADSADVPAAHIQGAEPRSGTHERVLLALLVLLFFLYVGAEASFGGWIFTYASATDLISETAAAYVTSAFWGMLTLGRLLGIPVAAWFRPRWILAGDFLGCLASVGVLLLWPNSALALWLGALGMGLFMATIFPTAMSLAERRMPITGQTTGWFFVGASVGAMILPWLIGQLFESIGPWSAMVAIAVDLAMALGVLGALILYSSRSRRTPSAVPS